MSEALQIQQEILSYLEAHRDRYLDAIRTLARIPAPSNHEELRAQWCKQHLEELGATGVYIDDALNVIFPYGVEEGANDLCAILGHTDVVFPDTEPLPFHEENGRFYAPGIGDDTTNAVAVMEMAAMAIDLKLKPKTGILFVLNSGEEGLGNLKGVRRLMQDFDGRISRLYAIDGGLKTVVNDAVGSKRWRITVTTEGGHSFGSFGNRNAIHYAAKMIDTFYTLKVPDIGKTTYNVGTIEGGTSVNTIAQHCEMLYEYRSSKREGLACMDRFGHPDVPGLRHRRRDRADRRPPLQGRRRPVRADPHRHGGLRAVWLPPHRGVRLHRLQHSAVDGHPGGVLWRL